MTGSVVVLDACTLVPMMLTDVLLSLAEAELFSPRWSEEILAEVVRTLNRIHPTIARHGGAERRVAHMKQAFLQALVTGHDHLISTMTNHHKDRHVLAVAVHSQANIIVTANLRDFPPTATDPLGIIVMSPDEFLLHYLHRDPDQVRRCLQAVSDRLKNPPISVAALTKKLSALVPEFCKALNN